MLLIKGPKWVDERGEARHHGVLKGLELRVVATYPLGSVAPELAEAEEADSPEAADASRGVILELTKKNKG